MMAFQNGILIIVATSLLWSSVLAESDHQQLLEPLVQNIDVEKSPLDSVVDDHYDDVAAVIDDATEAVDVDVPDAFGDDEDAQEDYSQLLPKLTYASSPSPDSVYGFNVKDLNGNDVSLSKYKGNVMLIVNYANFRGLTIRNVNKLSKMVNEYGPKGFVVLMFPSNSFYQNFGGETSGKSLKRRHPEFEVFSTISVNGESEDPLYTYLKSTAPGTCKHTSRSIKWNFTKFLIDQDGHPVARYNPLTRYSTIKAGVEELLQEPPQNIEIIQ